MLNKSKLTPEQLEDLSNRIGNRIQTIKLELEVSFNDLFGASCSGAELPLERVAEGIKEHLGVLWHVPARGADTLLGADKHKETCVTLGPDMFASFKECDCGAYGPEGPPKSYWALMSKFTKVKAIKSKVETIDECEVNHKHFQGRKCPACNKEV